MKVPFETIFEVSSGALTNKVNVRCGGITAYKGAMKNYKGFFGGVNFCDFIGRDLDVVTDKECFVIKGIY